VAPRLPSPYFNTYFQTELAGKRRPRRFAVITACDPMGKPAAASRNRAADKRLKRLLASLRIPHFRVTGGNKSGTHREPGWGLVVDAPENARVLAVHFQQKAYFWIASSRIYLGASAGGKLTRAGSWGKRQARWASGARSTAAR
jgi:hypothetical protein